ncbi:nucleocapsid protein [Guertu virus]|uniref:Nucleoprotein n=3 Tax=Guertu virus TaxID=1763596 RepID=A0A0S2Z334_9VIRU|nr:nucleocapsid protein [Guertu virus]ALQ33263.1 nucleocapsid protein [Guertu virus]QBQ64952.1 nucleoprotein [Guertu virus]
MSEWSKIAVEFGEQQLNVIELEEFARELAYEGLDPALIIKKLKEVGGDDWMRDTKFIIVFALTRGNKILKAAGKMSNSGSKRIMALQEKYGLVERAETRLSITPVRVAQSLPTWTCSAAAALQEYLPVGPAVMSLKVSNFPPEMMCMAFGSLIPATGVPESTTKILMEAYSLWQDAFTKTINVKMRGASKAEVYNSFRDPLHAAVNSVFFPNDVRLRWLKSKGILGPDGLPSKAVETAAAAYRNL